MFEERLIEAKCHLGKDRDDNGYSMLTYFWIESWICDGNPPRNVWIGTSVEDQAAACKRIPELLRIPARVRFLSCEPLLGPVDLRWYLRGANCEACGWIGQLDELIELGDVHGCPECWDSTATVEAQYPGEIHWVIAGGESGPGARPMHPDWARALRDQCQAAGVAFLFKQWGEWASDSHVVARVGKKAAGRRLDGREWNEFPVT